MTGCYNLISPKMTNYKLSKLGKRLFKNTEEYFIFEKSLICVGIILNMQVILKLMT